MARSEMDFDDMSVPQYQQLAGIIRGQVLDGTIPPNHAVPSKTELMARYGVRARTARDAMALLRDEGLIRAVRGKAYYVVPPEERG